LDSKRYGTRITVNVEHVRTLTESEARVWDHECHKPLPAIEECIFRVAVLDAESGEIIEMVEAQTLRHVRSFVARTYGVSRSQLPLSAYRARYFMEEGARAERRRVAVENTEAMLA
jgi:hypothetical protein